MNINNIYNLPEIEKDGISIEEYEHRLKYLNLYYRIITRCQNMTEDELSGYCEVHHILPRCLGGTDIKENLVNMPVRYHIMAHLIILEVYPDHSGLNYTINIMFGSNENCDSVRGKHIAETVNRHFSSRFIAIVREKSHKRLMSEETRRKISLSKIGPLNPQYGKKKDFEFKKRMSLMMRGKNNPIHNADRSKFKKPEYRPLSGGLNGKAKQVISPEGKIYESASVASRELNVNYKRFSRHLRGQLKDSEFLGWKYLDGPSKKTKKVINNEGKVFGSINEAAKEYGVSHGTIRTWIKGESINLYGLSFYEENN